MEQTGLKFIGKNHQRALLQSVFSALPACYLFRFEVRCRKASRKQHNASLARNRSLPGSSSVAAPEGASPACWSTDKLQTHVFKRGSAVSAGVIWLWLNSVYIMRSDARFNIQFHLLKWDPNKSTTTEASLQKELHVQHVKPSQLTDYLIYTAPQINSICHPVWNHQVL